MAPRLIFRNQVAVFGFVIFTNKAEFIQELSKQVHFRTVCLSCNRDLLRVSKPYTPTSSAWFDETHLAIAKVAGYPKWFNAAGPDIAKIKMGDKEGHNHFVNNPKGTVVTPEMILAQVELQPA